MVAGRPFEMLIVLLPIPFAMLLAWATEVEVLALIGVPLGVLLAWRAMGRRQLTWTEVGLRRPARPLWTMTLAVPAALVLLVVTAVLGALLATLTGWTPNTARFDVLRCNVAALSGGLAMQG
jgi:membrane protease YdiL (CAAX protease family)